MRVSERLLRSAISIAPEHLTEWGRAMLAESDYVQGSAARTRWELGATFAILRLTVQEKRSSRPRILFSVGIALTLIAVPLLAIVLRITWGMTHVYTATDVRVVSVDRRDINYSTPTSVLQFYFDTIAAPGSPFKVLIVTGDAAERDALLVRYQVGTTHRIGVKHALNATFGILPEYSYSKTLMPKMLGGSITFVLIAFAFVFVGWRRLTGTRLHPAPTGPRC